MSGEMGKEEKKCQCHVNVMIFTNYTRWWEHGSQNTIVHVKKPNLTLLYTHGKQKKMYTEKNK